MLTMLAPFGVRGTDAPLATPEVSSGPASHPGSINITLTSFKNPHDRRSLTISRSQPVRVGRASRTEMKNLQASPDNALFDCPVVSRAHAHLMYNPDAPLADQVTIQDKNSMHGTFVNGQRVTADTPFSLQSGDYIKFGDKVMRGNVSHDGVIVTFSRSNDVESKTLRSSRPTSTYKAPSASGDESPDSSDAMSVSSVGELSASANTTPEQSKPKLGSQEKPIELTDVTPKIVDLVDTDDETYSQKPISRSGKGTSASQILCVTPSERIIQDTADKTPPVGSASWPSPPKAGFLDPSAWQDASHVPARDWRAESPFPTTAGRGRPIDKVDEYIYHGSLESDSESEDADDLSDSDASELAGEDRESDEEDDDERPELQSSKKQSSPELGSQNAGTKATSATAPRDLHHPRYDPVRGSTPPVLRLRARSPAAVSGPANPFKPASTYTYASYVAGAPGWPATDAGYSSRWDIPPPSLPFTLHPQPAYNGSVNSANSRSQAPLDAVLDTTLHGAFPTDASCFNSFSQSFPDQPHSWAGAERSHGTQPLGFGASWQSGTLATQRDSIDELAPSNPGQNTKISIRNLVEDGFELVDTTKGASGSEQLPDASSGVGRKRKAEDVLTDTITAQVSDNTCTWAVDDLIDEAFRDMDVVPTPERMRPKCGTSERAAKRAKVQSVRPANKINQHSAAADAAKYALGATAGGVATMAFLVSPLAEKLLTWLS